MFLSKIIGLVIIEIFGHPAICEGGHIDGEMLSLQFGSKGNCCIGRAIILDYITLIWQLCISVSHQLEDITRGWHILLTDPVLFLADNIKYIHCETALKYSYHCETWQFVDSSDRSILQCGRLGGFFPWNFFFQIQILCVNQTTSTVYLFTARLLWNIPIIVEYYIVRN